MPSFDTLIEPDLVEIRNAVDQAGKEIATRFDFKGSSAAVDMAAAAAKPRELTLRADSDFQLQQVRDVLLARLAKRAVDVRLLDFGGTPRKIGGDRLELAVPVKSGIDAEAAKKIQAALKASKLRVQSAYQGDAVRVSGAKRDELQAAIALLRKEFAEWPLTYGNFRA
jgi:uncharacterized protein YajQ (UPF0234 family)